ncbi:hypothetical protein [Leisingera sp. ANG59]
MAEFHITLGISKDVAERDAESIEHHVSEDYLHVLKAFFWGKGEPMRSV